MSHETKKGELFLKEILSRLTGDQDAALAAKITRKAISAFDSQVAGLKSKLVDAEDALETAEEAVKDAIYPKEMITDNKDYCAKIVRTQEKVDRCKEEIDNITASLTFFTDLLERVG